MWKIWVGFLFVLIDIDLSLAGHQLSLVPDFIGYILLLWGFCALADVSTYFRKNRVIAGVMIFINLMKVISNFTGYFKIMPNGTVVLFATNILEIVVAIYLSYTVVKGFEELEAENEWELHARRTRASWKMITIIQVASPLGMIVRPWALMMPLVVVITSLMFIRDLKNTCASYKVATLEHH